MKAEKVVAVVFIIFAVLFFFILPSISSPADFKKGDRVTITCSGVKNPYHPIAVRGYPGESGIVRGKNIFGWLWRVKGDDGLTRYRVVLAESSDATWVLPECMRQSY